MALFHRGLSETASLGGRRLPAFFGMGRVLRANEACERPAPPASPTPGGGDRVLAALPAVTDPHPETGAKDEQAGSQTG